MNAFVSSSNEQNALVSIIVPVYNVEQYLDACVEQLVHQSYETIEIILVDDGSTDQSGALCDAWARRDERIRVIHQTNQGPSAARNNGLQEANGSYITYVDSDDYCAVEYVERLTAASIASQVDVCLCSYSRIGSAAHTDDICAIPAIKHGDLKELAAHIVQGYFPPCPWAKMYTREFAQIAYFDNGKLFEDPRMWARVFAEVDQLTFCSINEPLYYYRIDNNSGIMSSFHADREREIIEAWEAMCIAVHKRFGTDMAPYVNSCRVWMWFEVLDRAIYHGALDKYDYCNEAIHYLRNHTDDVYAADALSKRRKYGMRILTFSKSLYAAYRLWTMKHLN